MAQLLIIDGARDVGKSFLIDSLREPELPSMKFYKFNFVSFHNYLMGLNGVSEDERSKAIILGSGFGKDLQVMQLYKEKLLCDKTIIMDRGFLSSAVYATVYGRITEEEAKNYLLHIQERFYMEDPVPPTLYVSAPCENPHKRGPKDKWDDIGDSTKLNQIELYEKFLNDADLQLIAETVSFFYNQYDEKSVDDFSVMVGDILNEYE